MSRPESHLASAGLLDAAVLVRHDWALTLAPGTAALYGRTLTRFVAFAGASGVVKLFELDPDICMAFAIAPLGGSRAGDAPSPQTSRLRWGVVVGFLRALPVADLPAELIRLPRPAFAAASARRLEPLTPADVDLVRRLGRLSPTDSLRPVMVEAALAGGTAAEIVALTVGDVDLDRMTLRLPGRPQVRPRIVTLDGYAERVVRARLEAVNASGRRRDKECDPMARALALPRPRHQYRQASLAPLVSAGLVAAMNAAGVRRSGVRSGSLLAFAVNRVYALTGRVESVAELLGRSSLDTSARMVDRAWQESWGDLIRHRGDPGQGYYG